MKAIKTTTLMVVSILVLLISFCSTVYSITGNFSPDSTPYTGIVVFFSDAARQQPIGYSTGFLLSPTVMLTAGHSLIGVAAVSVCFDKGPISYSIENGQIVYPRNLVIYNGSPIAYPEYVRALGDGKNQGNHVFSSSDLGLIILDEPVPEVTVFPALPAAGFVDTLPVSSYLRVAGYGIQYQQTPKRNGVINSWTGTLSCNIAQVKLLSGNFAGSDKYIRCSANPRQGKGGVAFGDSGGPVLYNANSGSQDIVVTVNAYVSNPNCAGVTYHSRLDLPQVLSWINQFLN